ncbi:hypothetical protein G4B88_016997 [Cannabis sativa]|uniref:Reticulon-like protein n=1 Tax=Cannabis sativa TaxID=3483 RepID=A0A7J6E6Z5_CANSA|nr:hypothetical protein G4B88_016997 [Cannabis sativa]
MSAKISQKRSFSETIFGSSHLNSKKKEPVLQVVNALTLEFNGGLVVLHCIASGRDPKKFISVIASLWVLSMLGNCCNFLTLFCIAFVLLHTVPVLYEKYDDKVDSFAEKACFEIKKQYAVFDAKVLSKALKAFEKIGISAFSVIVLGALFLLQIRGEDRDWFGRVAVVENFPSPRPSTVAMLGSTRMTSATRGSRRLETGTSRPRLGYPRNGQVRRFEEVLVWVDSRSEPLVSVDPCPCKETVGIVPNLCVKFPITIGPNVGPNIGLDSGIVHGLISEKVFMSCDIGCMARLDNGLPLMDSGVNVDRAESSIDVVGPLVSCGTSLYSTDVGVNKNGINNSLCLGDQAGPSQKINSSTPSVYDGSSMGLVGAVEAEPIFGEDRDLSLFVKAQDHLLYDLKLFGKMDLFEIKNKGGDFGVLPTSETNERTTPFKKRKFEGFASLCSRPHKIIRTHPVVIWDFPWDKKDHNKNLTWLLKNLMRIAPAP